MKKLLLALFVISGLNIFATGTLTFTSSNNVEFKVLLNDVEQTDLPIKKQVIEDIPQGKYELTIEVLHPFYKRINSVIYVKDKTNKTYKVYRNGHGYDLRYITQTRISSFRSNQSNCDYHDNISDNNTDDDGVIIIDDGYNNINKTKACCALANDPNHVHVYHNTTNNGQNNNSNNNHNDYHFNHHKNQHNTSLSQHHKDAHKNKVITIKQNTCVQPVSQLQFNSIKNSIEKQSFTNDRKIVAKQAIANNCLSTQQLKVLLGLFSFDSAKLEIAEFGYLHVQDPRNYYLLNSAFSFSSSVKRLNDYVNQNKRN